MITPKQRMDRLAKEQGTLNSRLPPQIKRIRYDDSKWVFSLKLVPFFSIKAQTPYKNGKIQIEFQIPADYPSREPDVFVINHKNIFHPNVNHLGRLCYYGENKKPGPNLLISDRITMICHVLQNPNTIHLSNEDAGKLSFVLGSLYIKDPKLWFEAAQKRFESQK